jgi:hypothetical protein
VVCMGKRFSANLLCPYRAAAAARPPPWAVMSRASSAYCNVCDQTLQSFFERDCLRSERLPKVYASAPASHSGSAESAGQNSPGWSDAEPWVWIADSMKPWKGGTGLLIPNRSVAQTIVSGMRKLSQGQRKLVPLLRNCLGGSDNRLDDEKTVIAAKKTAQSLRNISSRCRNLLSLSETFLSDEDKWFSL